MVVTRLYRLHSVLMSNAGRIARKRRVDRMANATRFNQGLLNGHACIDITERVYAPTLAL